MFAFESYIALSEGLVVQALSKSWQKKGRVVGAGGGIVAGVTLGVSVKFLSEDNFPEGTLCNFANSEILRTLLNFTFIVYVC